MFFHHLRRIGTVALSGILSASLVGMNVFAVESRVDRNGDGVVNVYDYILEKRAIVDSSSICTLDVSCAEGMAGETVWLEVSMKNTPGLTGINFVLEYDPALKPFLDSQQHVDYIKGDVFNAYQMVMTPQLGNSQLMFQSQIKNATLNNNGTIARVGFTIPRNAQAGASYMVCTKSVSLTKLNGEMTSGYLYQAGAISVTAGAKWNTTPQVACSWGIDISQYQDNVDFQAVRRNGVEFAMLRAGYGMYTKQVDKKFYEHYDRAKAAGLPVGAYWFSYALTTDAAIKEAETCLAILGDRSFEFPIAFDVEYSKQLKLSASAFSAIVDAFCTKMEQNGYYVVVYGSASPLNSLLQQYVRDKHDVWVANYNVNKPIYKGDYGMWQFSSTGSIDGIPGDCDMDYAYKDYQSIIRALKGNKLT